MKIVDSVKSASDISLNLHISSNREMCNYNENTFFREEGFMFYCGFTRPNTADALSVLTQLLLQGNLTIRRTHLTIA